MVFPFKDNLEGELIDVDWEQAGTWVQFVTVDCDMSICLHELRPKIHGARWMSSGDMQIVAKKFSQGGRYDWRLMVWVRPGSVFKAEEVSKQTTKEPKTAHDFLTFAGVTLNQRGKDYDQPQGERSAGKVAEAFNAITGRNLSEAEIWLILQLVKDVRQWQNPDRYHADSALDGVSYSALKAEALARAAK